MSVIWSILTAIGSMVCVYMFYETKSIFTIIAFIVCTVLFYTREFVLGLFAKVFDLYDVYKNTQAYRDYASIASENRRNQINRITDRISPLYINDIDACRVKAELKTASPIDLARYNNLDDHTLNKTLLRK